MGTFQLVPRIPGWKQRRLGKRSKKRKEENEKNERLAKAKRLSRKSKITQIEKKINEGLEKLTLSDKQKFRQEESNRKAILIREARKDIWKLKSREKKVIQRQEDSEFIKELKDINKKRRQAGAELGQAQLKLGLDLDSINLN